MKALSLTSAYGDSLLYYLKKEKELLTNLNYAATDLMYTAYEKIVKVPQTGLVNYKGKCYGVDSNIYFKT